MQTKELELTNKKIRKKESNVHVNLAFSNKQNLIFCISWQKEQI
jgi:hypothetical protein